MGNELTQNLLSHCHARLLGILWITQRPFHQLPQAFYSLDYLMDGLLVKNFHHIESSSDIQNQRINLFTTPYFDHTLYLAHIHFHSEELLKDLSSLLHVLPIPENEAANSILVLEEGTGQKEKGLLQVLQKEFPKFQFQGLSI